MIEAPSTTVEESFCKNRDHILRISVHCTEQIIIPIQVFGCYSAIFSVLFFNEVVETIDRVQVIEALLGIFLRVNISNSAIGQKVKRLISSQPISQDQSA